MQDFLYCRQGGRGRILFFNRLYHQIMRNKKNDDLKLDSTGPFYCISEKYYVSLEYSR